MIPGYNRKSLAFGIPGLILQIGSEVAPVLWGWGHFPPSWIVILCDIGILAGGILLIIGLCYYAKSKGRNAAWGLFGFLSCIGIAVLLLLEDKSAPPPNKSTI